MYACVDDSAESESAVSLARQRKRWHLSERRNCTCKVA